MQHWALSSGTLIVGVAVPRYPGAMTMRDDRGTDLIGYLADRDVPCHACGYNLRGCREPFCPECGTVIPRPSILLRQQAMHCRACGYELGEAALERCPECGSDDIFLGGGDDDEHTRGRFLPSSRGLVRSWRGVPLILITPGLLSLVVAVVLLVQSVSPFSGWQVMLSVGAAVPAFVAVVWYALREYCNSWPRRTRARLALVACGGACVVGAMSAFAWY